MSTTLKSSFRLSEGVEEFSLENGLQILLKPIYSSNAVTTWIFYKVGSRNERPGITGASHWCEHMLFKGGGKLGKGDVHNLVSGEGGRNNAFTDHDLTAYYETLPKSKPDLGLFIESERMAHSAFDPIDVTSERQVIISEREGSENYPTYQLREEIYSTAYRVHPYRWPVVGLKSDLRNMTRDDLYEHYKKYYQPSNAILVVCGNFSPAEILTKIRALFSNIPAGEKIPRKIPLEEPEQGGERTSKIMQPSSLNYLGVAFHIPEITHREAPALIVLSSILGGWRGLIGYSGDIFVPKTNRLYKGLVEGKLVSEINTYFPVNIDPGLLYFEITLLPRVSLKLAREQLFAELERICDTQPAEDEMRIARNQISSWHAYENDGIGMQSLTIGFMQTIQHKDLADRLIENALSVNSEDVQRVAKQYLSEKNRVLCEYESTKR
ncbi:MAG: M16 family metallopeptidase [Rhabdochlamydiaceae bacterium]